MSLGGSFGNKALLVIDGAPRTSPVGARLPGRQAASACTGNDAVVEVKGKRVTLALGGARSTSAAPAQRRRAATRSCSRADSGGHFFTTGTINGKAVRFLVDTGATNVGIGQAEAERLGIDYRSGPRGFSSTANGAVPVYLVRSPGARRRRGGLQRRGDRAAGADAATCCSATAS